MLEQCAQLGSRIGILDIPGGCSADKTAFKEQQILPFRMGIGLNHLKYEVAYYPFLRTTMLSDDAIDVDTLGGAKELQAVLPEAGLDPVKTILAMLQKPAAGGPSPASLDTAPAQNSKTSTQLRELVLYQRAPDDHHDRAIN